MTSIQSCIFPASLFHGSDPNGDACSFTTTWTELQAFAKDVGGFKMYHIVDVKDTYGELEKSLVEKSGVLGLLIYSTDKSGGAKWFVQSIVRKEHSIEKWVLRPSLDTINGSGLDQNDQIHILNNR